MDRRDALKHIGSVSAIAAFAGCLNVQQQDSAKNTGGGQSGTSSNGSATAWYSLPESEISVRKDAIEAFNSQSEHTIKGSDISDLEKKTTSAVPAGQGPQTFEWAHDWVGDYLQRGFVIDQSDQLSVNLDVFTSAAAEAIQFDGAVVGLPHAAETVTLIYNTDMVERAPETVAEMVSVMKEHHNPGNGQYGLSYPFDPYFTSAWLQAFGGYYFDSSEDPTLGVNSTKTVRGLQFALENFKPYMANDPTYEPQSAVFAEGNAAFAINGPWYLATLNEKGVNYEVTTLPTPKGGTATPYTGITMWYFSKGMEDDSANTAAARSFIEWYVTNEDHIRTLAEEQGSIPVLADLVGSDELPDAVQAFSQTVKQGRPMPTDPKMNTVWSAMETALTKAFNGDASAKNAMNQAASTIRNNWK